MSGFDQLLKDRATRDVCPVPLNFDRHMEHILADLPEKQQKKSTGHPLRVALLAAALCVLLTVSALALSPTLRETLFQVLGGFGPYMQDVDEVVCAQSGIEVRVISAVADSYMTRVYAEVRDTEGDWLTADRRIVAFIDRSAQGDDEISIESGKCVGYDEKTGTILLEFKSWSDMSDDLGEMKLRIFSFRMNSPEERSGELDGEINLNVDVLTERKIILSGNLDGVELVEADISDLGIMLLTKGKVEPDLDHSCCVYKEDGTVIRARAVGGMSPVGNDGLNRTYLEFDDPVNPELVTGISVGCWMIPLDGNVAGAGYYKFPR